MRIYHETLNLLNNNGHQISSKIVTGDETYIVFFDLPTRQKSRVWIHKDGETPTMTKKHGAMKKVMYGVFFRSIGLVSEIELNGGKTVRAKWYAEKCLPEVFNTLPDNGIMLHYDNVPSHTAVSTLQFLAEEINK